MRHSSPDVAGPCKGPEVVESRGVETLTDQPSETGATDPSVTGCASSQAPRQDATLSSEDGRWTVGHGGESWSVMETFATKDEAIAYAKENEYSHVGRAHQLTAERVFTEDRLQRLIEEIDEDSGEEWGSIDDPIVVLRTANAEALRLDIAAAMEKHHTFRRGWFRIDDVVEVIDDADA